MKRVEQQQVNDDAAVVEFLGFASDLGRTLAGLRPHRLPGDLVEGGGEYVPSDTPETTYKVRHAIHDEGEKTVKMRFVDARSWPSSRRCRLHP